MTDPRRDRSIPAHVFVYLGLSAGTYAVALAGVTALESATEASQIAQRAPLVQALGDISAGHDLLAARLDRAKAAYADAAAAYGVATSPLAQLDASLEALATQVAAIDGTARSLPASVALPKVATTVTTAAVPKTQATTGASGVVK